VTSPSASPTQINDPRLQLEAKRAAVWIAMVSGVALAVVLAQPLLVIFGGLVFAALIDGGARLLGRALPIGRGWRIAIVLILTVAFFVWLGWFAGNQITAQAAALPETIQSQVERGMRWTQRHGIPIRLPNVQTMVEQAIGGIGQVTRVVGGLIGGLTTLFLILVLGIYIAIEPKLYQRGVAWMLPPSERDYFERTATLMGRSLRRLLAGRMLGMAVEGIATWILLQAYGVPMAALLGIITALLVFLPNIGAPLSGAIMIMVGFSGGGHMGIYTIIVYLVVQTVDGYIIVPMIARRAADLPPALVLGMQLIMGVLFGILGLALADPMVTMIKVWLEQHAQRNITSNGNLATADPVGGETQGCERWDPA
jgi:predicted PurR-regulated permease PerM